MPASLSKTSKSDTTIDPTRIGEYAAMQPLSGVTLVNESGVVFGLGRHAIVRKEEAARK